MKDLATKQSKLDIEYGVKSIGSMQKAIKDVDLNKRVVTGFYNTFNYFDSDADVLLVGSAKNSIDQHGVNSTAVRKIKHALNHNLTTLPGKIQVLEEKEIDGLWGIYFETKMSKTQLGVDTLINYQEGIYDNHSIGFRYLDLEFIDDESEKFDQMLSTLINPEDAEKAGYMYVVKEIEMFEGSTVAIGANQLTPYLGVKSGDKDLERMVIFEKMTKIEKQLKSGKQSDAAMYDMSIQLRQIKQMLNESFAEEKPALEKGSEGEKTFAQRIEELTL